MFIPLLSTEILEKWTNNVDLQLNEDVAKEINASMYTGEFKQLNLVASELLKPADMLWKIWRNLRLEECSVPCYIRFSTVLSTGKFITTTVMCRWTPYTPAWGLIYVVLVRLSRYVYVCMLFCLIGIQIYSSENCLV